MLLAFFVLLIPSVFAQTMQSLNGQIADITSCALMELSFDDCSAKCLSVTGCMIAYMENNDGNCFLCPYGVITTLPLDSSNIADLAIRCDNCTSASSTYQDGTKLSGHVTTSSGSMYYFFVYSNGAWRISVDNGCPSNSWSRFSRVLGPWCILPYYSAVGYDWDIAQAYCQSIGAVLSGMETLDELNYAHQSILSQWASSYAGFWWAGSRRRPQCTYPTWDTSICNNTALTSFYWTDNFTTGTAGYRWAPSQPSGTISATGEQESCMAIYASDYGWSLDGLVDDITCSRGTVVNSLPGLGLACGMKARH